jgi:hypothetical protein
MFFPMKLRIFWQYNPEDSSELPNFMNCWYIICPRSRMVFLLDPRLRNLSWHCF